MTREDILTCIAVNQPCLRASQPKLSVPVIIRLSKKMKAGIRFSDIKIANGTICDGHHRYIASLLSGTEINTVPSILKSDTIDWESVFFDHYDWDSKDKIMRLNKMDAHYNNLSLAEILEILK